ncbi:MAG: hypothetical protein ABSF26_29030 [Thermoguttaceae bacterium]|jgi:hypothetical protein
MTRLPSAASPPVEVSTVGRLIVCEQTARWSLVLRRELTLAGVRVWETRSLAEAWESLARTPAAVLVVEISRVNLAGLLERMAWFSRDFPLARLAVVAPRALAGCEWLLREAGAVHFVTSPRRLGPLAELAIRHLATLPPPQQTLVERIWAGLPWGR